MAVQAQYPSHLLLLHHNTSNLQPDYEQAIHQSHTPFTTPDITKPPPPVVNSVSLQSPQLLNHHHHNTVSTGLRLFSSAYHQRPPHLTHHSQQQQQTSQHASPSHHSTLSVVSSQDYLVSQIQRQRDEINQFLQAQEAELHRTLAEKRQRHYRELLTAAEEAVARRLGEKDLEAETVRRLNAELEARAAQLSSEAQFWQAKAKAHEATAASLQAQLQQAMMNGPAQEKRDDDALSCAAGAEDAESAYVDPDRVEPTGPKCRGCGRRVASVVVLPCRHLCLCPKCDVHFRACPVCLSFKDSTVEVFLT
ncbi:hypothetical protein K1719_031010 [Acacia pycnantha]|nr:hypothetical protein K1719_031010 [Acacia pycnantha]